MTLARLRARHAWILPIAAVLFSLLAIGAYFDTLPWDEPIFNWVVDLRSAWLVSLARRVSFLGSTPVVITVSVVAALVAWRRCPRLAVAILVVAAARPLIEFGLKELIDRERPTGAQLVRGTGPSFPSGHPLATAASWCMLPLVAALYVRSRAVWWSIAIGVWVLAVLVAASRVILGVHWPSDVVASLLLVVMGVAAVELIVERAHIFPRRADAPDEPPAVFKPCSLRAPRTE
jgi:membrane-associated phospholipid phosphatase